VKVPVRTQSPVNVCTFCGSTSPETPEPKCAHGRTALVQGNARKVAAGLWLALQSVDAHRAAFAVALDAEIKAGTASVDLCPRVQSPGSNVVFLQNRDVVLRRSQVG
jgi:hypothetical protein